MPRARPRAGAEGGVREPQPPREQPACPSVRPPLAEGTAPTWLHLPGSPGGRRGAAAGRFQPRRLPPAAPLSPPPRGVTASARLLPGRAGEGGGGGREHPGNLGGWRGRAGGASRDRAEAGPGARRPPASRAEHRPAALGAWATAAALCSKLQ